MRSRVEPVATALALVALVMLMVLSLRPLTIPDRVLVDVEEIPRTLPAWSKQRVADTLEVIVNGAVSPAVRDWLGALSSSGTATIWRGDLAPTALEADRDAISGAARVRVTAPAGVGIAAGDALGMMDSTRGSGGGAEFWLPAVGRELVARVASQTLTRALPAGGSRNVVVLAAAGWDPRFAVAALEAEGWGVETRLRVGPASWVRQGRPLPLDTARHAAVIAFGSVDPATAREIRGFVQAGGGLVVAGRSPALDEVVPGRLGQPVRPLAGLGVPLSRDQLAFRPILRLEGDASVLETALTGEARVAGRRLGAGRVVQLGDEDTWRLSLGSASGKVAHAGWWSRTVALATPHAAARPGLDDDVAPRAALVAAIGEPMSGTSSPPGVPVPWEAIAAAVLFLSLLTDWVMRRVHGQS